MKIKRRSYNKEPMDSIFHSPLNNKCSLCGNTDIAMWKRMIRAVYCCVILLGLSKVNGQVLHRQMLGSQGAAVHIDNGYYVSQSVGQVAIVGSSFSRERIVVQGFQQGFSSEGASMTVELQMRSVVPYPNPFADIVNFDFGGPVKGEVRVTVFDVSGRLVAARSRTVSGDVLSLQLNFLARGMYLVRLRYGQRSYSTKILKGIE